MPIWKRHRPLAQEHAWSMGEACTFQHLVRCNFVVPRCASPRLASQPCPACCPCAPSLTSWPAHADCHTAQGDSEISGTAIETSLTAVYRLSILPAATLPAAMKNLRCHLTALAHGGMGDPLCAHDRWPFRGFKVRCGYWLGLIPSSATPLDAAAILFVAVSPSSRPPPRSTFRDLQ